MKLIIYRKLLSVSLIVTSVMFIAMRCNKDNCGTNAHYTIAIYNNSSKSIVYQFDQTDTAYRTNATEPFQGITILANSSDNSTNRNCYENHYASGYSDYVMFFNPDTVNTIGWQAIDGMNRGLMKRIKVDLNYLKQNNFTITYP